MDTREETLRFYRTWAAPCYWLTNYVQGYSCNDIRIPNVYEGKYIENKDHGDLDRPLFNPPVARRKKKKGRKKRSRHTSGGEVGRKNGRTKKAKEISSSSADDAADDVDVHAIPFGDLFGSSDPESEPEKAAQTEESDEESAGEAISQSRPSVYKAGKIIRGRSLQRRHCRGVPDHQPRVQPKNATVMPTKSSHNSRMTTRASAAACSPDVADESTEQTTAAIQ